MKYLYVLFTLPLLASSPVAQLDDLNLIQRNATGSIRLVMTFNSLGLKWPLGQADSVGVKQLLPLLHDAGYDFVAQIGEPVSVYGPKRTATVSVSRHDLVFAAYDTRRFARHTDIARGLEQFSQFARKRQCPL